MSFGFQTWGRKTLQALIDSDHEVVLAVTHPASEESYKAIWSDSVEDLAREHGIPVHLTERVDAETIDLVKRAEPDVIVVNSWYTLDAAGAVQPAPARHPEPARFAAAEVHRILPGAVGVDQRRDRVSG